MKYIYQIIKERNNNIKKDCNLLIFNISNDIHKIESNSKNSIVKQVVQQRICTYIRFTEIS